MTQTTSKPPGPIACQAIVKVGALTLQCALGPSDLSHTRGITDGAVHQAEYRNVGTRVVISWEGKP